MDTLTLQLKSPVDFGGQTYTQIELAEPTAGQIEKGSAANSVTGANIIIISEVAKIPLGAVRLMKKRDYDAAVAFLQGFTPDARQTGEAS